MQRSQIAMAVLLLLSPNLRASPPDVDFSLSPAHSFEPASVTFKIVVNAPNTEQVCLMFSDMAGNYERTSCWPHRADIKRWRPVISNIPAGEYNSLAVITVRGEGGIRTEHRSVVSEFSVLAKG